MREQFTAHKENANMARIVFEHQWLFSVVWKMDNILKMIKSKILSPWLAKMNVFNFTGCRVSKCVVLDKKKLYSSSQDLLKVAANAIVANCIVAISQTRLSPQIMLHDA